jgi:hypothetical protein
MRKFRVDTANSFFEIDLLNKCIEYNGDIYSIKYIKGINTHYNGTHIEILKRYLDDHEILYMDYSIVKNGDCMQKDLITGEFEKQYDCIECGESEPEFILFKFRSKKMQRLRQNNTCGG